MKNMIKNIHMMKLKKFSSQLFKIIQIINQVINKSKIIKTRKMIKNRSISKTRKQNKIKFKQ